VAVDDLVHRLKHMNPRAPQRRVNFGDVPLASVFDLKGFNLNAKLDIDPEFLNQDDGHGHDHDHDHDHEHGDDMAPRATVRTTITTTTTSSPSSSAPTSR
jgi:G3E family GTPase